MVNLVSTILLFLLLSLMILFSFLDKRKKRIFKKLSSVSFIVPCYNDSKTITKTIESIYSLGIENLDLIVINDKSTDNSKKILEKLSKIYDFRLFNNRNNLGKTQSLNKYFKFAKNDILFFVDADVVVNNKSYIDVISRLQNKKVGAVSCPYSPENKGFFPLMQHIEYNMISLIQGSYNLFSAISLWGGFIGIKKEAFLQAGEFSLNAITEDMNLAFKLNKVGWKVEQSFFPIKTYVPNDFKSWFKQKVRWGSGGFQSFTKYFKIWLKNPIHVIFTLSFYMLMSFSTFSLINKVIFFNGVINYFNLLNETLSFFSSFKLIWVLYGLFIIKDLFWAMSFTFFSLPYIIPMIESIEKVYLIFLVLPFSLLYIPIFSIVTLLGVIYFIINYKHYSKDIRAW